MNSQYNQMPLDEQSRRITQFVVGNQQYKHKNSSMEYSYDQQHFQHLKVKYLDL